MPASWVLFFASFHCNRLIAVALLAACTSSPKTTAEPPTLKTLAAREINVLPDTGVRADEEAAARAYRDYLAAAPRGPQRQEAQRRLGDIEMDRVDSRVASGEAGGAAADYKAAITQYQDFRGGLDPQSHLVSRYSHHRHHNRIAQLDALAFPT